MQSSANTVSTITTWLLDSIAKSLRIKTKNKTITVESFSDAALSSPIQEDSHDATTAQETTKFGLLVSPSQYAESRSIQEINIERNQ